MKPTDASEDKNPTDTGNNFLSEDDVFGTDAKQQNVKLSKKA